MNIVHDFQLDVVEKMPRADIITAAMLNSCFMDVYVPDRIQEIEAMEEEERENTISSAYEHSLGRGHNAAAIMPIVFAAAVPRMETLRIARQPRGFDILQTSTRRVDHGNWLGVYEPDLIKKSPEAHQIFKNAVAKSSEYYDAVVKLARNKKERLFLRQYAMQGTPLYMMTGISFVASPRAIWQFVTEGLADDMPSVSRDVSLRMKYKARQVEGYEEFFYDWRSNWASLSHLPTGSDFLGRPNPNLEMLLNTKNGQAVLRGDKPAQVLGYEDPFGLTSEEAWRLLHEFPGTLESITLEFLTETSIANHHDMFKQRELRSSVEPLRQSVNRRSFSIPNEVVETGKDNLLRETSDTLINAYHALVSLGIPEKDAQGILPHNLNLAVIYKTGLWNLAHVSADRCCRHARPDLERWWNSISEYMREEVPTAGALMYPKGKQFGYCPDQTPCERCFPKKEG